MTKNEKKLNYALVVCRYIKVKTGRVLIVGHHAGHGVIDSHDDDLNRYGPSRDIIRTI